MSSYTTLWEHGRLDLTVKALIHDNPKWHSHRFRCVLVLTSDSGFVTAGH